MDLPPPDRLIASLREVERLRDLPPLHFQELVQTVYRLAREDTWKTFPGAAALQLSRSGSAFRSLAASRAAMADRSALYISSTIEDKLTYVIQYSRLE